MNEESGDIWTKVSGYFVIIVLLLLVLRPLSFEALFLKISIQSQQFMASISTAMRFKTKLTKIISLRNIFFLETLDCDISYHT